MNYSLLLICFGLLELPFNREVSVGEAMNALMSEYERQLQTPIRGMLFGSLMTTILIQMQKLKVHTEAAMLKMDQVSRNTFIYSKFISRILC